MSTETFPKDRADELLAVRCLLGEREALDELITRWHEPVWRYLRPLVAGYDASVFSLADFAQTLPHPAYLIPPSIDTLSEKNIELPAGEIDA